MHNVVSNGHFMAIFVENSEKTHTVWCGMIIEQTSALLGTDVGGYVFAGGCMAELQIEKSTVITQLEGSVFVISADGSVIRATVGMALQPGTACKPLKGAIFS